MYETDAQTFAKALFKHDFDIASELLHTVDIEARDVNGNTYLMQACIADNNRAFKWLLENHADINVTDEYGRNLLFLAIKVRALLIINLLADSKQFLSTIYNGQNPLHEAVSLNLLGAVKSLVKAQIDLDIQNEDGDTVFDLASRLSSKVMLKWLLTEKSFAILDVELHEDIKTSNLESLFNKFGYEYLNLKCNRRGLTISDYAGDKKAVNVLMWLESKNIQVNKTLLHVLDNARKKTINILILGETGVGKSTFINALVNYLDFNSLHQAENAQTIHSLIPTRFTIGSPNFQTRHVQHGCDENELLDLAVSATQSSRSYLIEAEDTNLRLIDTPGIGDTRGIEYDKNNLDQLLTIIGELKYVHGICILLKPNECRLNVLFQYCLKEILCRLQRDACDNITFVFTNSRGTFYRPGETVNPLNAILQKIKGNPPYVTIPYHSDNTFCLDNEAYRFLIAKRDNVQFSRAEVKSFSDSWDISSKISNRLLTYVKGLKPHIIQDTVSLNEARRLILRICQPLAEITDLMNQNIERNNKYKEILNKTEITLEEIENCELSRIELKVIHLKYPMTVCTHRNCTERVEMGGVTKISYKQICDSHCYLPAVPKDAIGDWRLRLCGALILGSCRHISCRHSFKDHMHIYYKTELYEDKDVNNRPTQDVEKTKLEAQNIENKIKKLNEWNGKSQEEIEIIQRTMAKFTHFLKHNSIIPYNDCYKQYIQYFIDMENAYDDAPNRKIAYKKLMSTYDQYIKLLETEQTDAQASTSSHKGVVSAEEITKLVEVIYQLPINGKTIKECVDAQQDAVNGETLKNKERIIRLNNVLKINDRLKLL